MPLKTIMVCINCGKVTCDGSVWKIVSVIDKVYKFDRTDKVHPIVTLEKAED